MKWKNLLILLFYAMLCFGGSFSDITCKSDNADATFKSDDDD